MTSRLLCARLWRRSICFVLAVVMATGPSLNVIAQTTETKAVPATASKAAPAGGAIDITYVTPTAGAVVVLRPAQIMKSPLAEMLPVEVVTAAGLKYLGIDPANVDEVTAFVDLANPMAPAYGVTLKLNAQMRASAIPEKLRAHTERSEIAGKAYLKSKHPMLPSFYAPNEKTLVLAPDVLVHSFVEAPEATKSGPIVDLVQKVPSGSDLYVAVSVTSLRPLIQMGLAQSGQPIPPEARPFLDALNLLDAAELTVNLSKAGTTSLVAHANDESAAEQVETLLASVSEQYQEKMKAAVARQKESEDPVERAMAQYTERVSGRWSQPFMPKREGADLTFFKADGTNSQQQQLVTVAIIGILVALLLPAVQAAREAARRNQSMNNLKQIILSLLNYHDTRKRFPAHAIYSKDGKPLLSWRVAVLPFIEEGDLYNEFHMDEPWDSEHNRALIPRMPQTYANPNLSLEPGKTNYLGIVGKEYAFDGTEKGRGIQAITDGTSKTVIVVEADPDRAVIWSKPDDLEVDAKNPTAGLGHLRPGGWLAAFIDGHIEFFSNQVDRQIVQAFFTCAGREVLDANALNAAPRPQPRAERAPQPLRPAN